MKPITPTESPRRRLVTWWWLSGITCAALAIWWISVARDAPEAPATRLPEVSRSELLLKTGHFFCAGETNPFTGVMVEFYADGMVRSRSMVSNGLLHGLSEGWYTNGQVQVREHFQAGLSHGRRTKWYADGQLSSRSTIVEGQLHGPYRRWHENGTQAEEVEMNRGQPDGRSRSYYPSGAMKAEARLDHGQVREQQFWKDREFYLTTRASATN